MCLIVLLFTPLLAVVYSLAYKGKPPAELRVKAPVRICKTSDCSPSIPKQGKRTDVIPAIISAPGGIPIVGNSGTVNNPTVNNYAPPERELLKEQCEEIHQELRQKKMTVMVGTMMDIPDGYDYALELLNCFKSVVQVEPDRVMYMGTNGAVFSGIEVSFRGETKPAGTIVRISDSSPEGVMIKALMGAHVGPISANTSPDISESLVRIIVGKQPKQP